MTLESKAVKPTGQVLHKPCFLPPLPILKEMQSEQRDRKDKDEVRFAESGIFPYTYAE